MSAPKHTPAESALITQTTLFEFPCDFPIKIMAAKDFDIEIFVKETLHKHVKNPATITLKSRESRDGKYLSITAMFEAHSKEQLDTLYTLFSKHPEIKFVL